ncbi:MAG: hypothetical protein ACLQBB_00610 [Solirubrobacteraceae bacterium]
MAKTWVLDTETKGTGAHVVPYEKTLKPARVERELALFEFDRTPRAPLPDAPPEPLRFKVVDVMSSQVLAEGASAGEAVRALEGLRSVLDARIFVWNAERGRWRLLSLEESKALWGFRGRLDSPQPGQEDDERRGR